MGEIIAKIKLFVYKTQQENHEYLFIGQKHTQYT